MSRENSAGLGVNNFYGPRPIPDSAFGNIKTEGGYNELTIEFSGKNINDGTADTLDTTGLIPASSLVVEAFLEVEEAFVLGGTTPVLEVGTDGSEATNGLTLPEADLEATGVYRYTTFTGTWAAGLAANTTVSMILAGTSPTITDAGQGRVVIRYVSV